MAKPAVEIWDEIAQQYADGVPVSAIAMTFNVSRATISRRAKASGWVRGSSNNDVASASPPAQDEPKGSSEQERAGAAHRSDPRAALIQRHRADWTDVYAVREDALRILKGEKPGWLKDLDGDGLTDLKSRVSLAEKLFAIAERDARALAMAQEGERRAHGFDYKQQQQTTAEDEADDRARREKIDNILGFADQAKRMWEAAGRPDLPESAGPLSETHPGQSAHKAGMGEACRASSKR
jgi:hypothetical protein